MLPSDPLFTPSELWRLFWAKTDRSGKRPEWTRPLWAHLYDVANAALLLWERVLPRQMKRRLAAAIGLGEEEAGRWLSMQIGLHDIGKAIPSFQFLHEPSRQRLKAAGFPFKRDGYQAGETVHHGHASIPILIDWFAARGGAGGWNQATVEGIAAMIGYHHGKLIDRQAWGNHAIMAGSGGTLRSSDMIGGEVWRKERIAMLDAVTRTWGMEEPIQIDGRRNRWPSWLMSFAGWCTLADWLGSMEEDFPEVGHDDDLAGYIIGSRGGAEKALARAGFGNRAALRMMPFGDLFRDSDGTPRKPRKLQEIAISRLPPAIPGRPTLTIVEGPAGEGKTEMVFFQSLRQQVEAGCGIYIGAPSQATGNALFARFEAFIKLAHDPAAGAANLVLVHSTSALHPAQERLHQLFLNPSEAFDTIYDSGEERKMQSGSPDHARVETASWFMPKKRSLLAPYGVGTVDQALLGVLYAKHFFLRQIGLAGKTVVFDEVHAYDTYMNTLFCRLLAWLRENGASVILLSATLPAATRRGLIAAWTGSDDAEKKDDATEPSSDSNSQPVPYPVVWHVDEGQAEVVPDGTKVVREGPALGYLFDAAITQSARLYAASPEITSVARALVDAACGGAAVAAIVNTVGRAQEIYREVLRLLEVRGKTAIPSHLFHARFPYELRNRIEMNVLQGFGPARTPGSPAILVATQVAEQSLDIDVDVMFTDLCPIDLLLQRAGRLHRHGHHAGKRPQPYAVPQLHILLAEPEAGMLPDTREINGHGYVYNTAMLYRTWQVLRGLINWRPDTDHTGWNLPADYRSLIEGVYDRKAAAAPGDLHTDAVREWNSREKEFEERMWKESREAEQRIIPPPEKLRGIAERSTPELAEQDEAPAETHPAYLALTRLGGPSVDVVCLHEDAGGNLWLDPLCTAEPLPKAGKLETAQTRRLLECSVSLSGKELPRIAELMSDSRWSKIADANPALRHYRVLVFRERHWRRAGISLSFEYDTTYGIMKHQTKEA